MKYLVTETVVISGILCLGYDLMVYLGRSLLRHMQVDKDITVPI